MFKMTAKINHYSRNPKIFNKNKGSFVTSKHIFLSVLGSIKAYSDLNS